MRGVKYYSPLMKWDDDDEMFELHEEMTVVWTRPGNVKVTIVIPKGFKSDLASIPKRLQSIVGKLGHHLLPAVAHDYIYVGGVPSMSKKEADDMFLDGMKTKKVWLGKRWAMWLAVRVNTRGGHWEARSP